MLRGIAATLVVLFHLQGASLSEGFDPGLLRWFSGGEAGVDIFFVLSGFVIFHATLGKQDRSAGPFLRQRFWRIVPTYWAVLALTFLALAAYSLLRQDWANWPDFQTFLISALLLPLPGQVMAVAWTLTIEAVFYVLFALSYFRFGVKGAIAALVAWALLTQVVRYWPGGVPSAFGLLLYSGVIEFLYGGLIALALAAGWRRGSAAAVVAGVLGLVAVVSGFVPLTLGREWVAGLPSAALVYGLAVGGWKMPNWAMVWGDSSYLLYLLHLLVFSVAGQAIRMAGYEPYGSVEMMLGLGGLAVAVSIMACVWLERPYRRWVRNR